MKSLSTNFFRAASLALALPILGFSAAVQIDGVCVNGNCISPAPVTYAPGNSQSGSTSNSLTLGPGTDVFNVSTAFAVGVDSGGGTYINFNPVATYIGASPSTSSDSFTVDLFASITDPGASDWNGLYSEHIPLIVAANSFAQGQLFVSSSGDPVKQGLGLLGHTGPGMFDESLSKTLGGLSGDTLEYDYHFLFNFGTGSLTGACDASPASLSNQLSCAASTATPEPASIIPAALGLLGFGLVALRRRK